MNREISEKIKILSFFMTCVIVFYHCPKPDGTFALGPFDDYINNQISYMVSVMGTLAMSYFFTVTGFLMFHNLSWNNYLKKIKKNFFFIDSICTLAMYYCCNRYSSEAVCFFNARFSK